MNKDDSFSVRNQGSDRKLLNVEPLQGLASMPQDAENAKSSKLKSTAGKTDRMTFSYSYTSVLKTLFILLRAGSSLVGLLLQRQK